MGVRSGVVIAVGVLATHAWAVPQAAYPRDPLAGRPMQSLMEDLREQQAQIQRTLRAVVADHEAIMRRQGQMTEQADDQIRRMEEIESRVGRQLDRLSESSAQMAAQREQMAVLREQMAAVVAVAKWVMGVVGGALVSLAGLLIRRVFLRRCEPSRYYRYAVKTEPVVDVEPY